MGTQQNRKRNTEKDTRGTYATPCTRFPMPRIEGKARRRVLSVQWVPRLRESQVDLCQRVCGDLDGCRSLDACLFFFQRMSVLGVGLHFHISFSFFAQKLLNASIAGIRWPEFRPVLVPPCWWTLNRITVPILMRKIFD